MRSRIVFETAELARARRKSVAGAIRMRRPGSRGQELSASAVQVYRGREPIDYNAVRLSHGLLRFPGSRGAEIGPVSSHQYQTELQDHQAAV